jgi:hypothetical protein
LRWSVAAAAALLLLLAATAATVIHRPGSAPRDVGSTTSVNGGSGARVSSPVASPPATGEPSADPPVGQSPSARPPVEDRPSEEPPSHSAAPPLVAAFTISASGGLTCAKDGFKVAVTVTGHAGTLRHTWVHWRLPNGTGDSRQLSNPSSGSIGPFTVHRVHWWVTADATDGSTADTAERTAVDTCPHPAG